MKTIPNFVNEMAVVSIEISPDEVSKLMALQLTFENKKFLMSPKHLPAQRLLFVKFDLF